MSIVHPMLADARVLDLFAGSGALGLEALSRGAASADFVELSRAGVDAIRANAASLGAGAEVRIHRQDAMRYAERLEHGAFDVAFADPPYGLALAERLASLWLERPFAAVLGIEHSTRETMPLGADTRRYGSSSISFYRVEDSPVEGVGPRA